MIKWTQEEKENNVGNLKKVQQHDESLGHKHSDTTHVRETQRKSQKGQQRKSKGTP